MFILPHMALLHLKLLGSYLLTGTYLSIFGAIQVLFVDFLSQITRGLPSEKLSLFLFGRSGRLFQSHVSKNVLMEKFHAKLQ